MPVLVPSFLPPPPPASSPDSAILATSKQPVLNEQSSSSTSAVPTPMPVSSQPQPLSQPISDSTTAESDTLEASVPTVTLPQSTIEPELAAALASSMLGHVLFLKGQVPMPAVQLARLPQPLNATKAKKRTELLNALDTLNSHLHTTFQALAEALVQRGQGSGGGVYEEVKGKENVGLENGGAVLQGKGVGIGEEEKDHVREEERGEAQVVFAVGPTPGAPTARVVFALRGLALSEREEEEESEEKDEESEEEESSDEELDPDEQPSSRAPSPPSTQPLDSTPASRTSSFTPFSNPSPSVRPPLGNKPLPLSTRPPLSHSNSSLSTFSSSAPPRLNSNRRPLGLSAAHSSNARAEAQAAIRAAERALGKTLAEDGRLAAGGELAPTHTHILLRAPRRFVHPAWRPRAQLGAALDSCVADALGPPNPKKKSAKKPEGAIVRASVDVAVPGEGGKEEDEIIWWLWDGRLTGFADW